MEVGAGTELGAGAVLEGGHLLRGRGDARSHPQDDALSCLLRGLELTDPSGRLLMDVKYNAMS